MRKKILGFVFAAALLAAMAVPMFGSGGTAEAGGVNVFCANGTRFVHLHDAPTDVSITISNKHPCD